MGILKKEEILYDNKDGEIQAKEVPLYGAEGTTIKIKPMVSDDLNKLMEVANKLMAANRAGDKKEIENIQAEMDAMDASVLDKHLIEPKMTAEEMKMSKPLLRDRITKTIMLESGIPEKNLTFGYNKEGDSMIVLGN